MELVVNELSMHGQHVSEEEFVESIERIMKIRHHIRRFGQELICSRSIFSSTGYAKKILGECLNVLPIDRRRAVFSWLAKSGPFWDDYRMHTDDDYVECNGTVVTGSSVGEVAWQCLFGTQHGLVSFSPSVWLVNLIRVVAHLPNQERSVDISNFWDAHEIEVFLATHPAPIESWKQLDRHCTTRFENLRFVAGAFDYLKPVPFSSAAAKRIVVLLGVLDRMQTCFDPSGSRNAEGNELYQLYFTGRKGDGGSGAAFSDSSDDEKSDFRQEMSFIDPTRPGPKIFCPWHGKVHTPQLRIHFSGPPTAVGPLPIYYIGPKITKR